MKKLIKPLWLTLAALSAILTVVSCVKELAVQEHEVSFESSLTTELSQIEESDSIVATQLIVTEEKVDCPRPTKYSVSFTYDEQAGTLFFFGESVQSGKPIALSSLSDLTLTYQAKELVDNKVNVTIENDAPKKLSKELVWNILADEVYSVTTEHEGEGEVVVTGADNLNAVKPDTKLAVTAKPADGWELVALTANDVDILEEKSFVVTENTTVRAVFTTEDPATYAVTLTKEGEGTVDISGADDLGAVVTGSKLTVVAEPADGWAVSSITANGKDITAETSFVVTSTTTIKVVFKRLPPKTYAVTLLKEGDGTVEVSGADNLDAVVTGSKLTITAKPADGWEIASMTANGVDILASKSFVVKSNTTIKVVFKRLPPKTYSVTLTKEGEGEVAISGADDLDAVVTGSKLTVTATPADGWEVQSITANGKDITAEKSFVVTSNSVVKVVFKRLPPKTYKVTLTKEGDGTVEVSGADNLDAVVTGSKLTITAKPADGWEIASMTANGVDILSSKSFVVTSNTVVKVVFKKQPPKTYAVTLTQEGDVNWETDHVEVVLPDGSSKRLEVGKPSSFPAGIKLEVRLISASWKDRILASMTANGVDISRSGNRSFLVTSDTHLKVVYSNMLKPYVDMQGRGKISVTFEELLLGKSRVYTRQDKPDYPDEAGYGIAFAQRFSSPTKVTITAEPADGWELEGISANNVDITASKTFTMTSDTEFRVFFRKKVSSKTYKVTVVCSEGGSVELKKYNRVVSRYEPVDLDRVPEGTDLTVISHPNEGYNLSQCFFNGILKYGGVITEDTEVRAVFRKKYY